jgi:hypothetical protein
MAEKEDEGFILVLFDMGKNPEGSEYLFRIIRAMVEMPLSGFPEEYWEFEDVFSKKEINQLTDHFLVYHIINIGDAIFPYKFIYKLSENELKILRRYLNKNLERKYIQYFISPVEASILFILKKDGSLRLYVDYRDFNKIIIKNRYPLFLVGETLNRFNGAAVYTKLDLKEAYYRIRIKKGDEWKTAFRIKYGYFEYKIMLFGLANTSATF